MEKNKHNAKTQPRFSLRNAGPDSSKKQAIRVRGDAHHFERETSRRRPGEAKEPKNTSKQGRLSPGRPPLAHGASADCCSPGRAGVASASKSFRDEGGEAFEIDSCDEMRRVPREAQAAQVDLISRLKDKVRSQAARLLGLETQTLARESAGDPATQSEKAALEEENSRLRAELSDLKQQLDELQRQVTGEQEEATAKLLEMHGLVGDLQAALKQECYKNEKLAAYVEAFSRVAEERLGDSKQAGASRKPELPGLMQTVKQVFEENYSLRTANHKLTGEMTESLESFKHRSRELKGQLQEFLGRRSRADEQLVETEKKLQESQSEVSAADGGRPAGETGKAARERGPDGAQKGRVAQRPQLEPTADAGQAEDGPRADGGGRPVPGLQPDLVAPPDPAPSSRPRSPRLPRSWPRSRCSSSS